MSFSQNVKEELAKKTEAPRHCMLAQLAAMTAFAGTYKDEGLNFKSENALIIRIIQELIVKTLGLDKDYFKNQSGKTFTLDKEISSQVLKEIKWKQTDNGFSRVFAPGLILKGECCKKAFLKGAFFCAGSVNDPNGAYHFEIACKSMEDAQDIIQLFSFFNLEVKTILRKKHYIAYLKEGENITEALNILGAFVAQMDFYNIMILKDMRNTVNRKVNCETANLNKTVSAAVKQIKDIEFIRDTFGLDVLGETLKETAILRLENPESSLKDLGEMSDPPLGKSGINHRLKSIGKFADEHRSNSKKQDKE